MPLKGPTAAGLMYSDTGGDGPVVVLLHGVLMNGTLWETVTEGLQDRYRCIVPELPFGAHTTPMPDDADLSLPALATLIAEFLTELDLHHVTLVGNDPSPPSAPCPSGGFPTTYSGAGSVRCATTPRSAATSPSTSATSRSPRSCSSGPTSSAPSPARSSSSGHEMTSSCPRPTPDDSPTTSRTPNSCGSTTAEPSSPSTSQRSLPTTSTPTSLRTRDADGTASAQPRLPSRRRDVSQQGLPPIDHSHQWSSGNDCVVFRDIPSFRPALRR